MERKRVYRCMVWKKDWGHKWHRMGRKNVLAANPVKAAEEVARQDRLDRWPDYKIKIIS